MSHPSVRHPYDRHGGSGRRPAVRTFAIAAVLALTAIACSSDDDGAGVTTAPTTETPVTEAPATDPDGTDPVEPDTGDDDTTTVVTEAPGIEIDEVPVTEPTLPEIGVPGLDDEDVVCRAWSRFAGSFQVAAVAASFADDPIEAARLEVVASPVVAAAVDDMIDNWPDALADEAEVAADGFIGPYARRSARALDALVAAGADDDALDGLAAAWLAALAVRDPGEILPELDLPDDLARLVEVATDDFDAQVVPIPSDPSLVTDVEVPATESFLFETCPDRGTLAGGEIVE